MLWDALEVAFHHAAPARRKASLPYVPEHLRDRWRLNALGQGLVRLRGTEQWKVAVATEPGSVRAVAAIYGEPRATVQRWRASYGTAGNGHAVSVDRIRSTVRFLNRHMIELDGVSHSLTTNGSVR